MIEIGTLDTVLDTLVTESPYFSGAEGKVGGGGSSGSIGNQGPAGATGPAGTSQESVFAQNAFLDLVRCSPRIDIDATHAIYSSKVGDLPTYTRLSSATFRNRKGRLVGRTTSSTSVNLSTLTVGTLLTITIPTGAAIDWQIGTGVALLSDTDDDNTIDAGESYIHAILISYDGASTAVLQVSSWGGSSTIASWSVSYRGPRFQYTNTKRISTNLILSSENFDTVWIFPGGTSNPAPFGNDTVTSSLVNAAVSPDNNFNATKITEITSSTAGYTILRQNYRFVPNQTYTFSVYAKYGNLKYLALHAFYDSTANSGEMAATFNLQDGEVGSATRGATISRSITELDDDWYRCSITFTTASSVPWNILDIRFQDIDAINTTITTRSGRHAYIWGAALEVGNTTTPYKKTTSAAQYSRECDGILIENSSTNLLQYSSNFSNSYWGKTALTVTQNSTVSPDGTLDSDLISETAASSAHCFTKNSFSYTQGETVTFSIFLKAQSLDRNNVILVCDNGLDNGFLANFDITKGEVASNGTNGLGIFDHATIEEYLEGWYRCSITGKVSNIDTNCRVAVCLSPDSTSSWYPSYTGSTNAGVYIWGAQFEKSERLTSLVETTISPGIRDSDSVLYSGNSFKNLWSNNQGTIVCKFKSSGRSNYSTYASDCFIFHAGTDSQNYIACYIDDSSRLVAEIKTNGVSQYVSSPRQIIDYTTQCIAISFKNGELTRAYVSGVPFVNSINISATLPSINTLVVGSSLLSTNYLNGVMQSFKFYDSYFSDDALKFLTSSYLGVETDLDAMSYSDAVNAILQRKEATIQDVISEEQRDAINRWAVSGKRDGWYGKLKNFYLPIWEDADANAVNLIDRTSGTFYGSLTHASGMCRGDGTSGYFNYNASLPDDGCTPQRGSLFFLLPNTSQTLASMSTQATLMGCSNGGGSNATYIRRSNSSLVYSYGSNSESTFTYFSGMHIIRKNIDTRCTYQLYRSILEDSIQGSTSTSTGLTTTPMTVWASNTAGTIENYSTFNIGCHGFGLDMTEVEASSFIKETTALWKSCTGLSL